jgi:hypothetical protein
MEWALASRRINGRVASFLRAIYRPDSCRNHACVGDDVCGNFFYDAVGVDAGGLRDSCGDAARGHPADGGMEG